MSKMITKSQVYQLEETLATKYVKPAGGIPKTDLASGVQASLGKADTALQSADLTPITEVIPAQATSENQLADKNFVNSSIATATATFRGTYNLVSDLGLTTAASAADIATALASAMATQSITPDANDYCFVQIPTADATPTEIARIDRYKHNGTAWAYEYSLNNSGFTADQWAAINSGITSALVTAFNAKYDKPSAGIPETDLTTAVQVKLNLREIFMATFGVTTFAETLAAWNAGKFIVCDWAGDIYMPTIYGGGFYFTFVQVDEVNGLLLRTRLDSNGWSNETYNIKSAIDAKYTKPEDGIPASDIATGVIPTVPTISTDIAADSASDTKTASPKAVFDYVNGQLQSAMDENYPRNNVLMNEYYLI